MLLLIAIILLPLLYIFITKCKYWESRGVPGPKPLPFIGNIGVSIIGRKNVSEVYADIYHKYKNDPFVGIHRMGQPCLLIRDPEIIKNVLIKDFICFMDNDFSIDTELDPLISRNTFTMKGEDWKRGRQFITPNFASGKVLTFVIYELAVNKKCQVKLREEINRVLKKYDGQFSYEAMQDMMYLDACVSETLRLYPTLAQLSKICNQPYTMTSSGNNFNNLSITLEKGTSVIIPLLGLQRDERYFPSPNKFIPERFLNKTEVNKNVYMPFGSGPRMCIGSRFGSMLVKVGIAEMIRNFEIDLNEKTIHPLQYEPIYFSLYPKGGVWLNCKKIKEAEFQ